MGIFAKDLFAKVQYNLVLTSSLINGPIVDFSASFEATRSLSGGLFYWGVGTQSIADINQLTVISSSLTGSSKNAYIFTISQSANFSIVNECNNLLTTFISSSNIKNIFTASGITLS